MNIYKRLFQWDEILEKMSDSFGEDYTVKGALEELNLTYEEFSGTGETKDIRAIYDHDGNKVMVNATLDDIKKYFSIAHEIGHALLHSTQNYVDTFINDCPRIARETEANIVAYELTMPIARFVKEYNEPQCKVEGLANTFFVEKYRIKRRIDFLQKKGIIG